MFAETGVSYVFVCAHPHGIGSMSILNLQSEAVILGSLAGCQWPYRASARHAFKDQRCKH